MASLISKKMRPPHFEENEASGSTADGRRSGSSRPIVEFTILRGAGGDKYPLRKEYFLQDGKPAKRGFANPARFHATTAPVPSHAQLGALLDYLESSRPDCCVIRGKKSRNWSRGAASGRSDPLTMAA